MLSPAVVRAAEPTAPGQVGTISYVSKTATSVSISWSAPADTGTLSIDDYLIQFKIAGGSWGTFSDGVGTGTSTTITGLTRGSSYSFRVAAVNALGQGSYLELQSTVIPSVLPSAPTSVAVTGSFATSTYSSSSRTITWVAPDDGGQPIYDYKIEYSSDGVSWIVFSDGVSAATSATVTGLGRGIEWGFRVSAFTVEGVGPSSEFNWIREIKSGIDFSCTLTTSGLVFCWGANNYGQLGRGATSTSGATASQVQGLTDAVSMAVGPYHACVVKSSGMLSCWGYNAGNMFSSGGPSFIASPLEITSLGVVQSVSVGSAGTCVVKSNQKVYCIGAFGTVLTMNTFTEISGITDASNSISVGGNHACSLTQTGGVKCWGDNGNGQIGDGTSTNRSVATSVTGISNATSISVTQSSSGGYASCVTIATGGVKCWGSNGIGRFNFSTIGAIYKSPISLGLVGPMNSVVMFDQSVCGLNAAGFGRCWGHNQYSALGDASYLYNASTFSNEIGSERGVSITERLRSISVGGGFGCAVTRLGTVWCWGNQALNRLAFSGGGSRATEGWWPRITTLVSPPVSDVIVTVPDVPISVAEIAHGENSVRIQWTAPTDDGGSSVADYAVQYFNGSVWTTFNDGISPLTTITVTGLPRGANYQFRVAAVNSLGQGAYSVASGTSVPAVVPRAPLGLKAARWTGGYRTSSADLSWTSPDNGGQPITDFNIEYRASGEPVWVQFNDGISTSQSVNVSGLARGTSYEFRVRAVNAQGSGPWTYSSSESISAGGSQVCVVQVNGQTKCWGANSSGQLGDGTSIAKSTPTTMSGTTRGVSNAVGVSHSCVLTALGLVYCVGSNSFGQLGDGTGVSSTSLVQVNGLTGVTKIAAGGSTTCAVITSGVVKCWGSNSSGQLGNGSTNDSNSPVSVIGVSGATAISVGTSHACAQLTSGAVQCWGNNAFGQLGNGTTADSLTAVSVSSLSGTTSIAAGGGSTCAVISTGAVKCWGNNGSSQLGNGSNVQSSVPVNVTGISSAIKVVSGTSHSCVLLSDSSVLCWGNNASGQLGNSGNVNQSIPVISTGVSNAIDIAAGSLFTCVTKSVGGADCWGFGGSGQLGDGLSTSSNIAVSVSGIEIVPALVPVTGPSAALALAETSHNDTQVALNWNSPVDNGGATITDYRIEYKAAGGSWAVFDDGVTATTSTTVTGLTRGIKYTFRIAGVNIVETGDTSQVSVEITPSVVPGLVRTLQLLTFSNNSISISWVAPADDGGSAVTDYRIEYKAAGGSWTVFNDGVATSTLAVITGLQQGTLYSVRVSAINANGTGLSNQLINDVRPATAPTVVTNLQVDSYSSSAVQISWMAGLDGGEQITDYVIEYTTGTTWTVLNDGVSTTTSAIISGIAQGQYLRVRVKAQNSVGIGLASNLFDEPLSNFDMAGHTCAVGDSGSVWCSGWGSSGQLGDGTTSAHYQLSRVLNVSGATRVAAGWDHSCAIVALGVVKCWGANATGQLGDGTVNAARRAVVVSGVSGAVEISAGRGSTCVVLNTGSVKCWGDNSQKQLGNNSVVTYSSVAVDVSGITTASKIALAQYTTCALLVDTTVKCWGDNRYSQVSNGGIVSPQVVPSLVANLTGVVSLSSDPGADVFCALTTSGQAWCWGANGAGQRGNGNTNANPWMTSPNGLASGVLSIAVGSGHSCAALTGNVIKCWGFNTQGGASGGTSTTNVLIPTTITGATGSAVMAGLYSSCSYSSSSTWQCWGSNSSFERGDGGPNGGGPYAVELARQSLLVVDKPTAPASLQVTSYSTSTVSLSWSAPVSNGGTTIYDYVIEAKDGANNWFVINDGVSASTAFTWASAVKGSSYLFRVSALNLTDLGSDATILSSSVVTRTVPGSPTSVRESAHTDTSLQFDWTAPTEDGGSPITDYKVEIQTAGGAWTVFADGVSTVTSAQVTGLTRGSRYAVRVSAVSAEGASAPTLSEQIMSMSLGRQSCAVLTSGQVTCWGLNTVGQLGVPPSSALYQQVLVPGISNATQVDVGIEHSCALLSDQSMKCWGSGTYGQLGNGSNSSWSGPVAVTGLTGVVNFSTGNGFTCANKSDATVWCWGKNDYRQVNNSNTISSNTPIQVTGVSGASQVESGDTFACAIIVSGQIQCWGNSLDGRLGNNGSGVVKVSGSGAALTSATMISLNPDQRKACAVNGSLRCWGYGFGNIASYITNLINVTSTVSIGATHICAIAVGGVACWGENNAGQLGSNSRNAISDSTVIQAASYNPALANPIAQNSGVISVHSGYLTTCARTSTQTYCWGDNDVGQMARPISGDTSDDWLAPTAVASSRWSSPSGRALAVSNLSETHSRTAVQVGWSAPADNGGLPVYDYRIQYRLSSDSTWTTFDDGVSFGLTSSVTGLTNGQQYSVRIAALTLDGIGEYSSVIAAYAAGNPTAVVGLASPNHTTTSFTLGWSVPVDDGGRAITDYIVEYKASASASWSVFDDGVSTSTSATVTGLTRGTEYNARVAARSANGDGVVSQLAGVVIPATVPAPLNNVSISAPVTGGSLAVSYVLGDNGGRPIQSINYRIDEGQWVSGVCCTTPLVINGLTNGTSYSIDVRIANGDGWSPISTGLVATPASTPSAPVISSASKPTSGGQLSVAFSAGADNGSTITGYEFSVNSGSTWFSRTDGGGTSSPLMISSLVNGTTYQVKLRAVNGQGIGAPSSAVSAVPATTPGSPTLKLEPSDSQLAMVFVSPTVNGGAAVTNYEFSLDGGVNWVTRSPASVKSPWSIIGLTNGVSYSISLRAVNVQGSGTASTSVSGTPASLPSEPSISAISKPVSGQSLDVEFTPPSSNGGAELTTYQYSLNAGVTWTTRADSQTVNSPMRISGLVNGNTYQVAIRALNPQGAGVASSVVVGSPAGIPGAPSITAIETPIDGEQLVVSFSPASANGAEILSYQISLNNGSTWSQRADGWTTESPLTVDGLLNGVSYSIRVRGVNAQGNGLSSASVVATPATAPGRATISSLDYGESRIYVDVVAPENGGSPITSYAVSVDGEETWFYSNSSSTSFSVGGLINGETYPVSVSAGNRQGYGPISATSYVTIGAAPEAVTTGAADVTASTVRLEGSVIANFASTTTEFQLSTTSNFSTIYKTVSGIRVSGDASTKVSVDVSDIAESTTYFYRIVARNSLGIGYGATLSFRTNGPLGITANSGSIYTNSTNVTVGVSWPRGSVAVIISNDGGFGISTRFNLSESVPWALQSSGNERLPKTVYAKFVLADGSRSSTYTDDIILDETAPILEDVTSGSGVGDGVSVMALVRKLLTVKASDANSGIARFELRSSAAKPGVFVNSSTPNALQHSIAISTEADILEVRVFDRAGNASVWKSVKLNAVAASTSPTSVKTVSSAVAKLTGTTAKVTVSVPSTLSKTCISKVVKGKKTSVCTPVKIVVSVSGGGSKTVTAKTGSNAISVPKVKKGATVTIKVGGKVIQKIKL